MNIDDLVAKAVDTDNEDTALIEERHLRNRESRARYRTERIIRMAASRLCDATHRNLPPRLRACDACRVAAAEALARMEP